MSNKTSNKNKLIMDIIKKFLNFYKTEDKDYFEFFEIIFNDVAEVMELFS